MFCGVSDISMICSAVREESEELVLPAQGRKSVYVHAEMKERSTYCSTKVRSDIRSR